MATKRELCQAEEAGWLAFAQALERIPENRCDVVGYEPGWSVKDMVGHIGCWQAEAVQILERIRVGTDRPERLDIDAMNARFVEANREQPVHVVKAECAASRNRMLLEFDLLDAPTPRAEEWFTECGANHYGEHLPRLLTWADALAAGTA